MPIDRKPYVYIAGPMTLGDMADNIRRAIRAAESVLAWGGIPYVPQTTFLWHLISPHVHDYWMSLDLPWLAQCDVVIRLEGESVGADREVAEANTLGIPVVTLADFLPWLDAWRQSREKLAKQPAAESATAGRRTVNFHFRVDDDLRKQIEQYAQRYEMTISDIIRVDAAWAVRAVLLNRSDRKPPRSRREAEEHHV